jgi:hypothetical protein
VKKLVSILLIALYAFASIGATVKQHYCMNQFVGSQATYFGAHSEEHKCGKCGMPEQEKPNGCCKSEKKDFKLKVDQQAAKTEIDFTNVVAILPQIYFTSSTAEVVKAGEVVAKYFSPPPNIQGLALYDAYCSYLI